MPRTPHTQWEIPVTQVSLRPGQSQDVDVTFPAPEGIGDDIIGVRAGDDVTISGRFDSIVDGLILTATISARVHAQCSRCATPLTRMWPVDVTTFFPYDAPEAANTKGEVEIIAGEEESEDVYPLTHNGAFADVEALIRDTYVEALPSQPLCKPDCKGLCSQCGVNLNDEPDHHHDVTDIRFASLEALKAQLEAQQD